VEFSTASAEQAAAFITGRLRNMLIDEGYRYDVVDAVEAVHGTNPGRAKQMVEVLDNWVKESFWQELLPAFSRCVRITRDLGQVFPVDASILVEKEEKELLHTIERVEAELFKEPGIEQALIQIKRLVEPINDFFDQVLVMAEDETLRESRLGILQRITALMKPYADFSKLEGF
jgi:glycyl-tRNA synthetase beta subunit